MAIKQLQTANTLAKVRLTDGLKPYKIDEVSDTETYMIYNDNILKDFGDVLVEGAGSPNIDGRYVYNGSLGRWENTAIMTTTISFIPGINEWYITDGTTIGLGSTKYENTVDSNANTVPEGNWVTASPGGVGPVPTITNVSDRERIVKISVSGTVTTFESAVGLWDDRATLTYAPIND